MGSWGSSPLCTGALPLSWALACIVVVLQGDLCSLPLLLHQTLHQHERLTIGALRLERHP